jgi:hypothetical protein
MSADASGDRTGIDNTMDRVTRVLNAQRGLLSCPGVNAFGISPAVFASVLVDKAAPLDYGGGPIPPDDPAWVVFVHLRPGTEVPRPNPLYIDGVRVYFSTLEVKPL